MNIVDFHTHILPGIDDGSRDIGTSLKLVCDSAKQEIRDLYLTPHFYPEEQNIESFFMARKNAFDSLVSYLDLPVAQPATQPKTQQMPHETQPDMQQMPHEIQLDMQQVTYETQLGTQHLASTENQMQNMPRLHLGVEVAFFNGISRSDHLSALVMQDTNGPCIMIEMPYGDWNGGMIDEITDISDKGYTVILAHIERFISRANKKYLNYLFGVSQRKNMIFQINSDSFIESERKGKKLLKLIRKEKLPVVLGSDCHSLNRRPQNLKQAREMIMANDSELLEEIDELSAGLLE